MWIYHQNDSRILSRLAFPIFRLKVSRSIWFGEKKNLKGWLPLIFTEEKGSRYAKTGAGNGSGVSPPSERKLVESMEPPPPLVTGTCNSLMFNSCVYHYLFPSFPHRMEILSRKESGSFALSFSKIFLFLKENFKKIRFDLSLDINRRRRIILKNFLSISGIYGHSKILNINTCLIIFDEWKFMSYYSYYDMIYKLCKTNVKLESF